MNFFSSGEWIPFLCNLNSPLFTSSVKDTMEMPYYYLYKRWNPVCWTLKVVWDCRSVNDWPKTVERTKDDQILLTFNTRVNKQMIEQTNAQKNKWLTDWLTDWLVDRKTDRQTDGTGRKEGMYAYPVWDSVEFETTKFKIARFNYVRIERVTNIIIY